MTVGNDVFCELRARAVKRRQVGKLSKFETAVRRVGVIRYSPVCKNMSPGAGERPLGKTYQTEKSYYVL